MIFECSGIELDTENFTVTREGQPVEVAPKVFDLLVYLMHNRDQMVTRDQLLEALWPGRVVHDNVLSNDIKLARAVLGDDGEQQKCIKTVRGRGYQFVGEVRERSLSDGSASSTKDDIPSATPSAESWFVNPGLWAVIAAVLLVSWLALSWLKEPGEPIDEKTTVQSEAITPKTNTSKSNSIAILPFVNRSNREQDAFFVDGFHDDLITQVSQINNLSTISRTSVMPYRDSSKSMRIIGNELGSAIIIEGGVQRSGEQIRINVQMIDALKDEHLWAETYTRDLDAQNVFEIQSEIAFAVANALRTVLSPQEKQYLSNIPTRNIAAMEAFFRGRVSVALSTSKGFGEAVEYFREAVSLDPNFSEAHAQLGLALLEEKNYSSLPLQENAVLAESAIKKALGLNPKLSEAYEALALLERHRNNNTAAEMAYERALELKPGNADAIRMFAYFKSGWLGQHQQALELLNAVKVADPQNPTTLTLLSQVLTSAGHFEEALASLHAAIASTPDFAEAHRLLGDLYLMKFYQHDQAIKAYRQYYFLDPDTAFNLLNLATAYDELGKIEEAVQFHELYIELTQDVVLSYIARLRVHIIRNEREQVERVFGEIEAEFTGKKLRPWVAVMLSGFDLHQGNPKSVIERTENNFPELALTDLELDENSNLFSLALVYATALHLTGEKERAAPLTRKILEILPSKIRHRWEGIQTLDTWLHVAMGNDDKAIQSLREWRAIGGRLDLTKHRMVPASLFDHPEFRVINNEILAELAEQRANLARMEAAGELAPIPAER